MSTRAQFCSKRCKQEDQRRREQAELEAAHAEATRRLRVDLLCGRTIVINRHSRGPHPKLIAELEAAGLLVPIHRRKRGESGAGSKWSNPFRLPSNATDLQRAEIVDRYRTWLLDQPKLLADLPELRGRALACWCWPQPCHGDVLAQLVNGVLPSR